jgi:hypothetical protein
LRLSRSLWLWTALFGLALGVRLVGVGWSLPNAERHYSYHPDEWLVLLASYFVINPYAGEFLPGFYNYGTLPMYLWSLWLHWLSAVGVIDRLPENATPAQIAELRAQLYLWARVLVALMGAGTAVVVGRTVAQVAGIGAGVVSALAMALAPAFVVHSRFMTVDVPTTFFVALAFHQAVALHASPRPMRTLLWGAFWAGCAAGSKYNAGLALLAPLVGLWLLPNLPVAKRLLGSGAAVGVAGLTFLIVCPGVWADSARFWANFWYEVRHVGQGHGEIFTDTGLGWLYHLKPNLSTGFGAVGLLASAVGWALHARNRVWWGVLAASLAYYLLIGAAEVRFLRYTFPLFPMLAMGVGLLMNPPSPQPSPPLRRGERENLAGGANPPSPRPSPPLRRGRGRAFSPSPDQRERGTQGVRATEKSSLAPSSSPHSPGNCSARRPSLPAWCVPTPATKQRDGRGRICPKARGLASPPCRGSTRRRCLRKSASCAGKIGWRRHSGRPAIGSSHSPRPNGTPKPYRRRYPNTSSSASSSRAMSPASDAPTTKRLCAS